MISISFQTACVFHEDNPMFRFLIFLIHYYPSTFYCFIAKLKVSNSFLISLFYIDNGTYINLIIKKPVESCYIARRSSQIKKLWSPLYFIFDNSRPFQVFMLRNSLYSSCVHELVSSKSLIADTRNNRGVFLKISCLY